VPETAMRKRRIALLFLASLAVPAEFTTYSSISMLST
jgi:hypothetical protein